MGDYPRFPISEMHQGKFPDSMEFQSWKVNFMTEVCPKTAHPHLTIQWIKEIEMAKSIDERLTSRSIVERTDFPDYDMLDAMIASALKKASQHARSLPKKSKWRRAARSKRRPILTRKTDCLHDLWAFSCNQCSWSGARCIRFVQYTLAERRRPRLRRSTGSSSISSQRNSHRDGPGRIVQVKIAGFCSASDCIVFVRPRNFRNNGQVSYSRLKTSVRLHNDQLMRTRNFRVRYEVVEREQWPRVRKERKSMLKGKGENAFSGNQRDNVRKETHVVSPNTPHL